MKKKSFFGISILASVLFITPYAQSAIIDFESLTPGDYSFLDFGDLTITDWDNSFEVQANAAGPPLEGNTIINYFDTPGDWIADFVNNDGNYFSIAVGDYNQDIDNTYLEAYDVYGNLIASDYYQNPASTVGGDYLTVSSTTAIDYVLFRDADPYPGAVYWDNVEYLTGDTAPVPEPATLLLFGAGLAGLAGVRRKKK